MFAFIKALLGVGVIGGSVIAPVALKQTMSSMEKKESLGKLIGSVAGKVISETGKKAIEIRNNVNVQKVLKEIKDKKCQSVNYYKTLKIKIIGLMLYMLAKKEKMERSISTMLDLKLILLKKFQQLTT